MSDEKIRHEQKETLTLFRIRNSDKYEAIRTTKEELTSEQILKIHDDIVKAYDEYSKQLSELPGQVELRTKFLNAEVKGLEEKKRIFEDAIRINDLRPAHPEVESAKQ